MTSLLTSDGITESSISQLEHDNVLQRVIDASGDINRMLLSESVPTIRSSSRTWSLTWCVTYKQLV